jgi:myo-inositol 2-dehydrogenase/D-chiro-inositol 1-dehydrogenase/scyllo-inositol 2-dehydrogenase (NAD+)
MDSWRTLFWEAYVAEAQAFADSILNDTESLVTGYDGKIALVMVNAGVRSYLEKRPVDIVVN